MPQDVGVRSYQSFKFDFDEFFDYCKEFFIEFGHMDISEKCVVVREGDKPVFIRRPTPEESARKIYNIGEKFRVARRAYNTGVFKQGGAVFTQEQFDKMTEVYPDWMYSGAADFEEFYSYCKTYFDTYGDLNVPLKYVAIKEDNGSIRFASRIHLSAEEKGRIVFNLGVRLLEFNMRQERYSRKNEYLINRHMERLYALDPYWNYPRDIMGNRIDPVTKECVDRVKDDSRQRAVRQNSMFQFDEFYAYFLMYKLRYNSMNIHSKCVCVLDEEGQPTFMRMEQAKLENKPIKYNLGWVLKELTYYHKHPEKGQNSVKRLSDAQYKKLEELCPNWYISHKSDLGRDYVSEAWEEYQEKHNIKARVYARKVAKKVLSDDELNETEVKKTPTKPQKHFDFELFYSMCKKQRDLTGELQFSKSKVVYIKSDSGKDEEYPIGFLYRVACATKCYELDPSSVPRPEISLRLDSEQTKKMEELDKLWYLTPRERRQMRGNGRIEKNSSAQDRAA